MRRKSKSQWNGYRLEVLTFSERENRLFPYGRLVLGSRVG